MYVKTDVEEGSLFALLEAQLLAQGFSPKGSGYGAVCMHVLAQGRDPCGRDRVETRAPVLFNCGAIYFLRRGGRGRFSASGLRALGGRQRTRYYNLPHP